MSDENLVADELLKLERDDGRLLPEDVVAAAAAPEHPLHAKFEWDDEKAGSLYRIQQARVLIRSVKLRISIEDVPVRVVRYVAAKDDALDDKPAYRDIRRIREEHGECKRVLDAELNRILSAATRAQKVAAVIGVQSDIERIGEIARGAMEAITKAMQPEGSA